MSAVVEEEEVVVVKLREGLNMRQRDGPTTGLRSSTMDSTRLGSSTSRVWRRWGVQCHARILVQLM